MMNLNPIQITINVKIKLQNQPHTFLQVVCLKWFGNLQKHLEKFELVSTSTFGTSDFGQVHYIPVCDCESGKKVLMGCNKVHHIPH
jgi:hypothetical protein